VTDHLAKSSRLWKR